MPYRNLLALCFVLGLMGAGVSQQTTCKTIDVPVGVISASGDAFRGLAAEDFVGRIQKRSVTVKTLTFDDGPRRVLLVVDASKKLSNDSRKAENEMVRVLLASARPADTFAIMTARGSGQDVNFSADRSAILEAVNHPAEGKRGKEPGVLDTVMAGIEWFGAPQSGDAIVVIAADLEGNHKANAGAVAKALAANHIRMFGLAMGPVETKNSVASGMMTSTTSQGLAQAKPLVGDFVYDVGDEHFFPLTTNSGGIVVGAMNQDPRVSYSLNDAHVVQAIRQRAHSISNMISAYYRMQVEPPKISRPEGWDLTINEEMQKHSSPMFVLFPHELGPC
jgi:hypothetical protein